MGPGIRKWEGYHSLLPLVTHRQNFGCLCDLLLCWSRGLSSKERNASLRRHGKKRLLPGQFGLVMPLNHQAKKGVTVLVGVTDSYHQEEIGLLLHNRGKKESIWNTGDPLGCLSLLLCLVIKVDGKLQQPNPGRLLTGPDTSGRTFRSLHQEKN